MNSLEVFFDRFDLEPSDFEAIYKIACKKSYNAGDIFIPLGSTRKKMGIVETGLARGYRIKSSGEEVSIDFAKEGEIASTQDLILYKTESEQIVEFLEPSTLLVFDYRDIERLAQENLRIERLKNTFIQDYLVKILHRFETFLVCSPQERYEWLIKEQPELLKRVQQKHLASYLGITPVSLSRLRTRRNKR
ncbi:MAG: Crp/Fnr family transcriptional regulator [Aureispira sp.]